MHSTKDMFINVHEADQNHTMHTIKELFTDVHQSSIDQESRLRKDSRVPPAPKPRPARKNKTNLSVMLLFTIMWDSKSPEEVQSRLDEHVRPITRELRSRVLMELQKPGGGVMTMDVCTMGMFIIGIDFALSWASLP